MRASILLATVACAAALTVAPFARANTLCVHQPGSVCPAGSTDEGAGLQTALDAAGSDGGATTIDVLAGTYPGGELSLSTEPLVIAGAGSGKTILSGDSPVLVLGCAGGCSAGTFAVHDIGFQLTGDGASGLGMSGAFDAHDIAVTATTATGVLSGVSLAGSATLERSTIALPQTGAPTTAVAVTGTARVADVNLVADIGVTASSAASVTVTRSTIAADVAALQSHSPGLNVDSSLIRLSGDSAQAATSIATGVTSSVSLLNTTVLAGGTNDVGLVLQSEGSPGNHQATASVRNSILWGLARMATCTYGAGGPLPAVSQAYDDVDPATTPISGACTGTPSHQLSIIPGYVSGTDLHLRHDSPLVDQGDPSVATPAGTTDLANVARLADGDGNGSAVRDIGAYEYQHLPPVAALSAPTGATAGQVLTFDASASFDPDPGEAVTAYHWDFGDGASASTAVATHAFATNGTHVATASLTDPTGQTTVAHVTVTVPPPPPPAAPGPGSSDAGQAGPGNRGEARHDHGHHPPRRAEADAERRDRHDRPAAPRAARHRDARQRHGPRHDHAQAGRADAADQARHVLARGPADRRPAPVPPPPGQGRPAHARRDAGGLARRAGQADSARAGLIAPNRPTATGAVLRLRQKPPRVSSVLLLIRT